MTNIDMDKIDSRCKELMALKKGWLDGNGEAITEDIVNMVKTICKDTIKTSDVILFPTEEGGVDIEYTHKDKIKVSIGIYRNGEHIHLFVMAYENKPLDLKDDIHSIEWDTEKEENYSDELLYFINDILLKANNSGK